MEKEQIIASIKKMVPKAPSNRTRGIKLPQYMACTIDEDSKTLRLYIRQQTGVRGKGNLAINPTCDNMQTDNAAFEGWAVCLKAWLPDKIAHVELKWDKPSLKPHDNDVLHYHRFLYRALRFSEQYEWFSIDDGNRGEIDDFKKELHDLRNNSFSKVPELKQGPGGEVSETVVEFAFATIMKSALKSKYDLDDIGRQFPVGVKRGGENFFTGGLSAIDLWGTKADRLTVIELKYGGNKNGNMKVGIISELFLYANIMLDIIKGKILPPDKTVSSAEGKFYNRRSDFRQIRAEMLADKYHPLVDDDRVFDVLNNNRTQQGTGIRIVFNKTKYSFALNAAFED